MAINITLYDYSGMNEKLKKEPSNPVTVACTPYEPLSDLSGYVILEYDATKYTKNYAKYINKFYFIYDRELMTGGKMKLFMRVDSLTTYQTGILKSPIIPKRSSSVYNSWIYDEQMPFEVAATSYSIPPTGRAGTDYDVLDYDNMSLVIGAIGASVWEAIV